MSRGPGYGDRHGGVRPDPPRDAPDQAQLRLLLLEGHDLRDLPRGEAALRADGEPLERHVPGRLLDPRDEVVRVLERAVFRRHEPEHNLVVGQDVRERRKGARAVGVVLEQEPVDVL